MRLKLISPYCLMVALASVPTWNLANAGPESISETEIKHRAEISTLQRIEKDFDFDWNRYVTIEPNKLKIANVEAFIATLGDPVTLSLLDRQALGKIFYKLGTFYTHIERKSDLAIAKLSKADQLLSIPKDKAWIYNHLAYAYEQKFAASKNVIDKKRALDFTHKVIAVLYPGHRNQEVAFAYCVRGLIHNDAKDFDHAEKNYRLALHLYEKMPNGKDDQYARAKNRLAHIILDQTGREKEALTLLEEVKNYWQTSGKITHDPYAARNLLSLGEAYLKVGNAIHARREFENAILIYKNVYGQDNDMLAKPYQLLAAANQKIRALEQASLGEDQLTK
ncbi:MAG: tetratricopeptide repeat protein [Gammaproteobacteria bacterium]|nr:tetratricopeptide repeat protein [Gammaproteobacteria bacterium]